MAIIFGHERSGDRAVGKEIEMNKDQKKKFANFYEIS
jgi:hypothetical protein